MARSYAAVRLSMWTDDDFRGLSPEAQRVYILILSQPNLSYAGVVPYTARRWARMAAGTTVADIEKAVDELVAGRFVVVDEDTEELFVRTFVKHNGVLEQPQLRKAMEKAYHEIQSPLLKAALLRELPAYKDRTLPDHEGGRSPSEPLSHPAPNPDDRVPEGLGAPRGTGYRSTEEEPEPLTSDRVPVPEPSSSSSPTSPTPSTGAVDDDDGGPVHPTGEQAFELIARKRFNDRNRSVVERGGQAITGRQRREDWIRKDIAHSRRQYRALVERFLEAAPDMSPEDLAGMLDSDAGDAFAELVGRSA